ncbi:MAG: hypothetical protein E4H23_09585 [Chrysiogenales bacterium]|nr:MAG: hypothetical protein E4H23_09585 [Chrysiogenales bacterium]
MVKISIPQHRNQHRSFHLMASTCFIAQVEISTGSRQKSSKNSGRRNGNTNNRFSGKMKIKKDGVMKRKVKMKKLAIVSSVCALMAASIFSQLADFPKLTGPYLGQKPPGMTPEIFAPGIVSTRADESALEISAAGNEILFIRKNSIMLITRNGDGTWNKPVTAPFSGEFIDDEPCYSPDGNKIYFMSRRPSAGSKIVSNLWVSERNNNTWTEPVPVSGIAYNKLLHAPTIAANGNIYDTGIIRFKYSAGKYLAVERLPSLTGVGPFIFPDESYIIFSKRSQETNSMDLFISFQQKDGVWSNAFSLGKEINTQALEGNSFVTADGKYLFFSRKFDIFWVSAKIIEDLRPQGLGAK